MLFHTQTFLLLFFPTLAGLYYAVARHGELRIYLLIMASIAVYSSFDIRFLPLLLGQAVATWLVAEFFFAKGSRFALWLGIAANVAVLASFKWIDFLVIHAEALTGVELPRSNWALPIGLSFYTFELVSYLADQMRGRQKRYPFSRFMLFVLYFPRLISGPIVRHDEIVDQFDLDPLRPDVAERLSKGFVLLVIGLAKKLLLADPLAKIADPVFASAATAIPSLTDSITGTVAFTFQIYFDFSAYSDMAIGISLIFGIVIPNNFDAPYRATSLRDFWRRWHMTLSRFIRDYLYIPLGGSTSGAGRFVAATMIAMTVCGLWHGAGWTFLVWGMAHGAGLIVCHAWQKRGGKLPLPVAWALTMACVVAGWVLFRAPNFDTALNMFGGIAGFGVVGAVPDGAWLLVAASVVAMAGPTSAVLVERFLLPWRSAAFGWAAAFVYLILLIGGRDPVSFIYFQF